MKLRLLLTPLLLCAALFSMAQTQTAAKPQTLPQKVYTTMHDSTTSMDVVLMQGKGGSLSLEGRNVQLFNSFFVDAPAQKFNAPLAGNIMWLINGREYISGSFYLGEKTGYVVFNYHGKEYVNLLNEQGNAFFASQIAKQNAK